MSGHILSQEIKSIKSNIPLDKSIGSIDYTQKKDINNHVDSLVRFGKDMKLCDSVKSLNENDSKMI